MRTSKPALLTATATAAAFALAGCLGSGDDGSDPGASDGRAAGGPSGTLRYATESPQSNWLPWTIQNDYSNQVYETLVRHDPNDPTNFLPLLATEWEQTADRLTLTLRQDVVFHDGTRFDARAARASLEAIAESEQGPSAGLETVRRYVVEDDRTLTLRLSAPSPALLDTLTQTHMVSPKALREGLLKRRPVGTGPWRYDTEASTPGTRTVTTYFDRYWRQDAVQVETIETIAIADPNARLSAVQTGEADLTDLERTLYEQGKATGFEIVTAPAIPFQLIFFSRSTGPLADENVRKAVCHGVDVSALRSLLLEGQVEPSSQRFREGQYGHNPELEDLDYDPTESERLLAAAGDPDVSFSLPAFSSDQGLVEALAGQLAEIGVDVKVQAMPPAELFDKWGSDAFTVAFGNVGPERTPFDYYQAYLAPDGWANPSGASSPTIVRSARRAIGATDLDAAAPHWQEVAEGVRDEAITCANMVLVENLIYDGRKLEGVDFTPTTFLVDFPKIRVTG